VASEGEQSQAEEGIAAGPSVTASRGTEVARVDRGCAVQLRGEAAARMCDGLGSATREGLRLARRARPGEVFELVPPKHLAKGVQDKTLTFAKPSSGDASVLIHNVKDGEFVGRADLNQIRPSPAEVLGPAAWQAMALATQQHYLAEISAKLEGIQQGVDELKELHKDDRIGSLKHLGKLAARIQAAAQSDRGVTPHQLAEMRRKTTAAEEIWHQAQETAARHVREYAAGEIDTKNVEESLAILMFATSVLAHCSQTLASLPYTSVDELDAVLSEEQARMYPALPQFLALCDDLLNASETWRAKQIAYQDRRPKNIVAQRLHLPPVEVTFEDGFTFHKPRKPKRKPLSDDDTARLRSLAKSSPETEPLLVAEVGENGTILLGPPQRVPEERPPG
jgi:hypothetical protein